MNAHPKHATAHPVKILQDWGDVLAVFKPSGWLTVPGRGHKENVPILSKVLGEQLREGRIRHKEPDLFVVHRLDEYTSGVCLFAKTAEAHRDLCKAFEGHEVKKTYWALCQGILDAGTIDAPLFKIPSKKIKSVVDLQKGKPSKTIVHNIYSNEGITVVEAQPLTGRSHQIRVHLSYKGHPILGDKLYGGITQLQNKEIPHPLLHARRIEFSLPHTCERVSVQAEPEGLFQEVLQMLGCHLDC